MKKGKIITFAVILIIIVLSVLIVNSQIKGKLPQIKTVTVSIDDIQTLLSTNAMIQSKETKNYIGSAQYTVDQVNFEVGDPVKTGDVLLTYDLIDLNFSVEQARIQYKNAVLNKEELIVQRDKINKEISDLDEQIFALDGSDNPQDIANVQSMIQKRKAIQTISDEKIMLMDNSIVMAELSLQSALERLKKVKDGLIAEFDGVVTSVNAVEGIPLTMSQPAFVVQQLDNLKGVIRMGKYDAAKVRIGQSVTLKNLNNIYEGTIFFIEPSASKEAAMASESTLQAEIDILNPDENLKIDFDINADILIGEAKQVLTLPIECIQFNRDSTSVFVVKDGIAKLVQIEIGLQSDTKAEILEGLSEGDIVISNPSSDITDGTVVFKEGAKK